MTTLVKTILTGIILSTSITLFGQSVSFLNIPHDARSLGMGGASVAMDANTYAIHNNPAAIALSEKTMSVGLGYALWQPTSSKNNLMGLAGYIKLKDNFGIGFSGRYITYPSYQVTDMDGAILKDFSPNEFAIDLGFSYRIIPGLSIGATMKFIGSSMADSEFVLDYLNGSAFAVDLALMYKVAGFKVALMGTNLGTKIRYGVTDDFGKYNLPAMIRGGVVYDLNFIEKHRFTTSLEANYLIFQKGFAAGLGVEYAFMDMLSIRGGYHYGYSRKDIPSFGSVGLGFKIIGICFNAAYLIANSPSPLQNTFSLSLEFEF